MASVLIIILCLSPVITWILFGMDKRKAVRHRRRISEATLLVLSIPGGIGGLLGMLLFHHKTRKWKFRILVPLFAVIDAMLLGFFLWTSVYYHAGDAALAAMRSDNVVSVERTEAGWLFDGPSEDNAMIFYPGAKVEATAYAPLLHALAAEGMDVCLVEMPFHLAIFGRNTADRLIRAASYHHYFIGGHSLGGAMSASYAAEHEELLDGMVLLAAYPTKETSLDTILICGSEDGVLNLAHVEEADERVSGTYDEHVIVGGNHAQFGDYGRQAGDGIAAITAQDQWDQTVYEIITFFGI